MKKFITTILKAVVIGATIFGFTAVALDAWDNEYEYRLKKEFDFRYEHRFDEEEDLFNLAYIENIQKLMPDGFRFASWGYPKFDEILNKAKEFYDSSKESGCTVEFEECYNITKLMYETAE